MKKVLLLSSLLCLFSGMMWAQTRQVTGQVVNDGTGEMLSGASITVKGSSKGTVTDPQGKFSITIPGTGTTILEVKSVG